MWCEGVRVWCEGVRVWCEGVYVCLCGLQVLIFSEKKAEVDDIHEYLLLKGVQAVSIHGGKGTCVGCFAVCQTATSCHMTDFLLPNSLLVTCRSGGQAVGHQGVQGGPQGCAGGDRRCFQGAGLPRDPACHQLRHADRHRELRWALCGATYQWRWSLLSTPRVCSICVSSCVIRSSPDWSYGTLWEDGDCNHLHQQEMR